MIPESVLSWFRRTPVDKAVTNNLHEARLTLLTAQDQAEYWSGMVKVLKTRVARLEALDAGVAPAADLAPAVETPAPQVEEQQ